MMDKIANGVEDMKLKQIEEYEVNPFTMFIKPIVYGSKIYSEIFEVEDKFLSPFKPLDIIKNSCEYYGSDYEGRRNGTKRLVGYAHKIPITIDPTNRLFFFPTTSPNSQECIWISQEHVKKCIRTNPQETLILFNNNQSYTFPVSCRSIMTQLERAAHLSTKLMQRIEYNERKSFYLLQRPKAMEASEDSFRYGKNKIKDKS
ncbi:competence protein ComK [Bacillus sp. OK048]|uniref:competence protein ComK n=2 Tax=Bacillaceae TaxID=186817 RepID=UPI0020C8A5C5|nr:competence protein ComK [Bacillus sp. OK048]